MKLKLLSFNIGLLLALALPATAQTIDDSELEIIEAEVESEITETEIEKEEAIEADTDGSLDDTMNSIDVREAQDGIGLSADIRVGHFEGKSDDGDTAVQSDDLFWWPLAIPS